MSRKFGNQELLISSNTWIQNNQLQYESLVLEKRYSHKEILKIKKSIDDLDILKCNVTGMEVDRISDGWIVNRGKLKEFKKVNNIETLLDIKNNLLQIRTLDNDFFEKVDYKLIDGYIETFCYIDNIKIDVDFNYQINKPIVDIQNSISKQIIYSLELFSTIDIEKIKNYIATKALDIKDGWIEEGHNMNLEFFINKIEFVGYSIYEDLEYTFTFSDGDICEGHYIHARATKKDGLIEAYMQ